MASCTYDQSTKILLCNGTGHLYEQNNSEFEKAETLIIGSGITRLRTYSLQICKNLQYIEFGPTLQALDDDVFIGNPFTSLFIPKNVVSISSYLPWDQNKFITNITIDKDNPSFTAIDNVIYTKDMKTLFYIPPQKNISVFIIPFSVEIINNYAFSRTTFIEHIVFPPRLKEVRLSPFHSKIKSMTFFQYSKHDIIKCSIPEGTKIYTFTIPLPFTIFKRTQHCFNYLLYVEILIL